MKRGIQLQVKIEFIEHNDKRAEMVRWCRCRTVSLDSAGTLNGQPVLRWKEKKRKGNPHETQNSRWIIQGRNAEGSGTPIVQLEHRNSEQPGDKTRHREHPQRSDKHKTNDKLGWSVAAGADDQISGNQRPHIHRKSQWSSSKYSLCY